MHFETWTFFQTQVSDIFFLFEHFETHTLNITSYVKQLRGEFKNFASNDILAVKTKPRFIKIW